MDRRRLLLIGGGVLLAVGAVALILIGSTTRQSQPVMPSSPQSSPSPATAASSITPVTSAEYLASTPAIDALVGVQTLRTVNIFFSKQLTGASDIRVTTGSTVVSPEKAKLINNGLGLTVPVTITAPGIYTVTYLSCPADAAGTCHEGRFGFTVQ